MLADVESIRSIGLSLRSSAGGVETSDFNTRGLCKLRSLTGIGGTDAGSITEAVTLEQADEVKTEEPDLGEESDNIASAREWQAVSSK